MPIWTPAKSETSAKYQQPIHLKLLQEVLKHSVMLS